MKLPITCWTKVLGSLGYRVNWQQLRRASRRARARKPESLSFAYEAYEARKVLAGDVNQDNLLADGAAYDALPAILANATQNYFQTPQELTGSSRFVPDIDSEFEDEYGPPLPGLQGGGWDAYSPPSNNPPQFSSDRAVTLTQLGDDQYLIILKSLEITRSVSLNGGGTGAGSSPSVETRLTEYAYVGVYGDWDTALAIQQSEQLNLSDFESYFSILSTHEFRYEWTNGAFGKTYEVSFNYESSLAYSWRIPRSESAANNMVALVTPDSSGSAGQIFGSVESGNRSNGPEGGFATEWTMIAFGSGTTAIHSMGNRQYITASGGDYSNPESHSDDFSYSLVSVNEGYHESGSYKLNLSSNGTGNAIGDGTSSSKIGTETSTISGEFEVIDLTSVSVEHHSRKTTIEQESELSEDGSTNSSGTIVQSTRVVATEFEAHDFANDHINGTFGLTNSTEWGGNGTTTKKSLGGTVTNSVASSISDSTIGIVGSTVSAAAASDLNLTIASEENLYADTTTMTSLDLSELSSSAADSVLTGTMTASVITNKLESKLVEGSTLEMGGVVIEYRNDYLPPDTVDPSKAALGNSWRGGLSAFRNSQPDKFGFRDIDAADFGDGNAISVRNFRSTSNINDQTVAKGGFSALITFLSDGSIEIGGSKELSASSNIDDAASDFSEVLTINNDYHGGDGWYGYDSESATSSTKGAINGSHGFGLDAILSKRFDQAGAFQGYDSTITGTSLSTADGNLNEISGSTDTESLTGHASTKDGKVVVALAGIKESANFLGTSSWNDSSLMTLLEGGDVSIHLTSNGTDTLQISDGKSTVTKTFLETVGDSPWAVLKRAGEDENGEGMIIGGGGGQGEEEDEGDDDGDDEGGPPSTGDLGEAGSMLSSGSNLSYGFSGYINDSYNDDITHLLTRKTDEAEEPGENGDNSTNDNGAAGDPSGIAKLQARYESRTTGSSITTTSMGMSSGITGFEGTNTGKTQNLSDSKQSQAMLTGTLLDLINDTSDSSTITRTVTFNSDGSTSFGFDGTSASKTDFGTKREFLIDETGTDEDQFTETTTGKLEWEGKFKQDSTTTFDDLKYTVRPVAQTSDTESQPEVSITGKAITKNDVWQSTSP